MVEYNFPWSGTSPGKAGPYSAELFRLYVETLFTGLNRANAGVLLLSGDGVDEPLTVQQTAPASAQVVITPGAALVNGGWYYTNADVNVTIAANSSGNPRIDYLILRFNATAQTITLVDLQGTPAVSPVVPTLTQTAVQYEIPLAQIAVANLFTTIVTANINNNVRTFARLAQINEGGTGRGYGDYTSRQSLIGVSGAGTWAILGACTVERLTAGAALAAGSYQTLELAEGSDPDGLITVASNQITFANAGLYRVTGYHHFTTGAAGSGTKLWRLRNITTTTTLVVGDTSNAGATTVNRQTPMFDGFFLVAAGDVLEIQVYSNTATIQTTTDGAVGGETPKSLHATFHRITAN